MSLINDMLKDLEARKGAASPLEGGALPHGHIDDLKHADITPSIEFPFQRHIAWFFWPLLLLLLAVAVAALYMLPVGKQFFALEDGPVDKLTDQQGITSPPASASAADQTISSKPQDIHEGPRLVMLAAQGQERELRLDLAFDAPLPEALRLSREGERVELYLPGIRSVMRESPHAMLQGWQSQKVNDGWMLAWNWPAQAWVELQQRKSDDGLQHWQVVLKPAILASAQANLDPQRVVVPANAERKKEPIPATPSKQAPHGASSTMPLLPAQQAEALYAEGWQLQQRGRLDLAIDKLRQALQIQPEHWRVRELLAHLQLRAGQPQRAEQELMRGLALHPRQPELVELWARLLADQGRIQEALTVLKERMQADRLTHQALFAALAARAGQHAMAAEAYRHAAELDPRDPRWPLGRAIALENSGQPAAARAAYAQALGLEGLDAASRAFAQERLQQLSQGE
ncbi:MAG: tetratricopeptide repeat protein [Halothiobacillaceae bacterium]